ncbi:uncharacterized protein LOC105702815 [Orussus abietinus]|uniref:uncharacterized protein LOC105702815 n=1 Tax=Orussus abietinus TaxID=222816 RepID=UPI000624F5F5|nr:uncharacterized protein LOC105702815 [Orussus abietinus]
MILTGKPYLKIDKKKVLHLCRRPGFLAWFLFSLTVIVFISVLSNVTRNPFVLAALTAIEVMFGLDALGEWEDMILDMERNEAIISRCTWLNKIYSCIPVSFLRVMKLNDIRHVGATMNLGLFLLHRSGKVAFLSTYGLTYDEVQTLKKKINHFLSVYEIEKHDERPAKVSVSESESVDSSPKKWYLDIMSQTNILLNVDHLEQMSIKILLRRLSTPSFYSYKHQYPYQRINFKKGYHSV